MIAERSARGDECRALTLSTVIARKCTRVRELSAATNGVIENFESRKQRLSRAATSAIGSKFSRLFFRGGQATASGQVSAWEGNAADARESTNSAIFWAFGAARGLLYGQHHDAIQFDDGRFDV